MNKNERCTKHINKIINYVCLDPHCYVKARGCVICIRDNHMPCKNNLSVRIDELNAEEGILHIKGIDDLTASSMKTTISTTFDDMITDLIELKTILLNLIDDKSLCGDKIIKTLDEKKKCFDIEYNDEINKIIITPKILTINSDITKEFRDVMNTHLGKLSKSLSEIEKYYKKPEPISLYPNFMFTGQPIEPKEKNSIPNSGTDKSLKHNKSPLITPLIHPYNLPVPWTDNNYYIPRFMCQESLREYTKLEILIDVRPFSTKPLYFGILSDTFKNPPIKHKTRAIQKNVTYRGGRILGGAICNTIVHRKFSLGRFIHAVFNVEYEPQKFIEFYNDHIGARYRHILTADDNRVYVYIGTEDKNVIVSYMKID